MTVVKEREHDSVLCQVVGLYAPSTVIVIGMLTDYGFSHFVMKFVKTSVENSEADNTESISQEIKLLVSDKSVLYRRIADAYPDVIYRTERIMSLHQEVDALRPENNFV